MQPLIGTSRLGPIFTTLSRKAASKGSEKARPTTPSLKSGRKYGCKVEILGNAENAQKFLGICGIIQFLLGKTFFWRIIIILAITIGRLGSISHVKIMWSWVKAWENPGFYHHLIAGSCGCSSHQHLPCWLQLLVMCKDLSGLEGFKTIQERLWFWWRASILRTVCEALPFFHFISRVVSRYKIPINPIGSHRSIGQKLVLPIELATTYVEMPHSNRPLVAAGCSSTTELRWSPHLALKHGSKQEKLRFNQQKRGFKQRKLGLNQQKLLSEWFNQHNHGIYQNMAIDCYSEPKNA